MSTGIVCGGLLALCVSCTEYTPKPRGYFRIEPPAPSYQALPVRDLPYTFRLSRWAEVELPPVGNPAGWINLSYPQLNVKLYCSYAGQGGGGVSRVGCPAIEISGTDQDAGVQQSGGFGLWIAFHAGWRIRFAIAIYVDRQCLAFFPGSFVL